jgi:hypothetical protein
MTCFVSVPDPVYEHDLARRLLGYPETHHCEYILSFGLPGGDDGPIGPNKPGGRRPLAEIVHEEHWHARTAAISRPSGSIST